MDLDLKKKKKQHFIKKNNQIQNRWNGIKCNKCKKKNFKNNYATKEFFFFIPV